MHLLPPPECKDWSLWIGPEIEGQDPRALGKRTLFIRDLKGHEFLDVINHLNNKGIKIERIWFCAAFRKWNVIREVFNFGLPVSVEVVSAKIMHPPDDVMRKANIYMKIHWTPKEGDHICVGMPYSDETFALGVNVGNKMTPDQYYGDINLLDSENKLVSF